MTGPYEPDPLIETLAQAMGKVYPSRNSIQWADKLAAQYGQDATIKALGQAAKEVQPHEVLGRAADILDYDQGMKERKLEKAKAAQREQAAVDRMGRQNKDWEQQKERSEQSATSTQSLGSSSSRQISGMMSLFQYSTTRFCVSSSDSPLGQSMPA